MRDRNDFQPQAQPWLMVTKKWGEQSNTVMDPIDNDRLQKMLPEHECDKLKVRKLLPAKREENVADRSRRTLWSMTSESFALG